ncbi:MAG TPA: amidohydrolase family protein [Hyphomicrobiaceae bacterium]|jgi:predicted TIM-barrel fold metal-dependent hydrolase|nr:amidohydrolase family protein [Hyphomicrobiaceae bacterium]
MKIIDCHAHVSAPAELWAYKASLLSHRGAHGRGKVNVTDDEIRATVEKKRFEGGDKSHLAFLDEVGTDVQCVSPRPFQMMQSEKPKKIVQWFTEETNNIIHRQTQLYPDRFVGVAGLPQPAGEPLDLAIGELERCVREFGFKGCLLNPDPYENSGAKAPPMGDRYWYPLYEKLVELDVPALIHATGSHCPEREPYTLHFINEETTATYGLVNSGVFKDFSTLKIIMSHGGGAVPYQLGRFEASSARNPQGPLFSEAMRNLYYDTVLYSEDALKLLIKTVGADRCLFGAECPGVGSSRNRETGRTYDDIAPYIRKAEWLSDADKAAVLADNARKVFKLAL